MSHSAPVKRKLKNRLKVIESDSGSDNNENLRPKKLIKNSQFAQKPKRIVDPVFSSSDDEENGIFFLIQYIDAPDRFDIIEKKNLVIEKSDQSIGKVKYLGKFYSVKILKMGSKDYIEKKSERFAHCLSLNTCDEFETEKQLKDIIERGPKKNNQSPDVITINFVESENREELLINEPLRTERESTTVISEQFELFVKKTQERELLQQQYLKEMEKKIDNLSNLTEKKKFLHNKIDLIADVDGYPIHIWAANCLEILFSPEETKNCVLVKSTNSTRPACCPIKVKLLKDAMIYKYNLPADKQDKIWKKVIEAFNTKGRGIKFNLKKAASAIMTSVGLGQNQTE